MTGRHASAAAPLISQGEQGKRIEKLSRIEPDLIKEGMEEMIAVVKANAENDPPPASKKAHLFPSRDIAPRCRMAAAKIGNALSMRKRAFPPTSLAKMKNVSNPTEATRNAPLRGWMGN